jgi:hypothetical protein
VTWPLTADVVPARHTFQAFVPDRIAELDLSLQGEFLGVLSEAERAVDALNRDPPLLEDLETLARQLLRAESVGSSRIEGLVLSHRRLARAAFGAAEPDLTAESVLGNIRAMDRAILLVPRHRGLDRLRHRRLGIC